MIKIPLRNPIIILLLIALFLLPLYYPFYGRIESRLHPVIVNTTLIGEIYEDSWVVSMGFTKVRECELKGIAAFIGIRGARSARVPMKRLDGEAPESYPLGEFDVPGEWIISTNEPFESIFIDVLHRCHPFWVTRTKMWN